MLLKMQIPKTLREAHIHKMSEDSLVLLKSLDWEPEPLKWASVNRESNIGERFFFLPLKMPY